ncbi:hypothetical protein [Candidatus Berkiella aquae]|uniref:Uncharacterized protein n=1 Tax=Candidatus Berkiella aquae TaxID=295108 RepID=A0A0Q9YZA9_9GAMM|nr:hypothetical protein [Candidatus Berkiella aquae]MCS5711490.1 hypothetical protein [Candidatus Berkiella aquae]
MTMKGLFLTTSTTALESYQVEVSQLLDANLDEQRFSEALSQKLATQKSPSEHLLFIAEMNEQFAARHKKELPLKILEVINGFLVNLSDEQLIEQLPAAHAGKSGLWLLASIAPEAFLTAWKKLCGNIPAQALLKEAQMGPHKGKSALWLLACKASEGKPAAFFAVWDRVKSEINFGDLLKAAQEEPHVGKDILGWLVRHDSLPFCAFIMGQNAFEKRQIVKEALTQFSGALPATMLQQDSPLDKLLKRESLLALSEARHHFFLALDAYKETDSKENEENVWEKAQEALEAGYLNAFYDLGNHYFAIGEIEGGFAAYEEVPAGSWQYGRVMDQLCAHHFGKMTASPSAEKKLEHLKTALGCALKTSAQVREQHIQMLAAQYLHDFNLTIDMPMNLMPSDWLAMMDSRISAEMGFKVLEEFKERSALEKRKQVLQEQLAQKEQALQEQLVQQAQAQPADRLPEVTSQLPILPQFSASRDKRLRETDKSPADSKSTGVNEQPLKKQRLLD